MGSKRKRNEKKKDFQKTKLKVGKTLAKPDNYTDTSFTAKSISLPNQTISKKSGGNGDVSHSKGDVDITHQLLLMKHHLASTRKEVVNFVEAHLPSNTSMYKQILTMTISLVTDPSASVRDAFVSLLSACADKQAGFLELHMRTIVLFVHSAMTHIKSEVRGSSTKVLDVLVKKAPIPLVKGHFVKTLRSYFPLMAWTLSGDKKAISLAVNTSDTLGGISSKVRTNHLAVLERLLESSLFEPEINASSFSIDWTKCTAVHPQSSRFLLPSNPQAYTQLKLYVDDLPTNLDVKSTEAAEGSFALSDIDSVSTEDQETRRKITYDVFLLPLRKNLGNAVKEGGEFGKQANKCLGVLERFEKAYEASQEK
ncbi:hypothetical protein METBIDRAFT_77246 [Metschnikowia bicuspidata var. bicuspidata NRRL YB-4993]|uniref:Pre-rRNA-processing protein n=1 Tax=Metschnikowia bicuspidata var. bicuspidata NRRL YB-4993 TaxID=869754 RepID=A0A1A0HKN9_9ASCO|nr:hypothetical protein METBIDRAFT_77246 [Metschnikowia bicuspidata var. bicuspidata NRRL YB-4993]OBA24457.1 hypothetical protein METBIDRAFT_77246 [Metschnikowia bicuspidata var. bicuspidata NRRL YB-4993]